MTDAAYVGLDHDGALVCCASVVDGVWDESFSLHVAVEINGSTPVSAPVFETAQRRFRTREYDGVKSLARSGGEDVAAERVQALQGLIDHPALATGRPVKVALGLPVQRFFKDLQSGTPDIEFQRRWLAEQEIAVIREPVPSPVNVVSRNVASRGIAAYFDWTRDQAGQLRTDRSAQEITIVDVGAIDTTVLVFTGDQLKTEQSVRIPLGYLGVLEGADDIVSDCFDVPPVRLRVLLAILMEGRLHHQGVRHDAMPLLRMAAEELTDAVREQLALTRASGVTVVVGPAAGVLAAGLSEAGCQVEVAPNPMFANARGMTKFLRGAAA